MLLTEVIFQTDRTDVVGAVWVGVMGGGFGGGRLAGLSEAGKAAVCWVFVRRSQSRSADSSRFSASTLNNCNNYLRG